MNTLGPVLAEICPVVARAIVAEGKHVATLLGAGIFAAGVCLGAYIVKSAARAPEGLP